MDLTRPLALLAFAGTVLLPVTPASAACEVTVASFEFSPASKTVAPATTVQWCWEEGSHTVTFDDGPSSGIQGPSASYQRTFGDAGTFAYHCDIHPTQMKGTIVVQASPTPSKTSPAPKPTTTSPTPRRTTAPPTVPPTTRTATPTTAAPTTSPPATVAPTTVAPTTAPAVTTSPPTLDIDPAVAKPKTGLAVVLGLLLAGAAFGGLGWLLLKGRSG